MAESGFDEFQSDYNKENWIDNNTWESKKIYDDSPYVVLPGFNIGFRLGSSYLLKLYIKCKGEQFGDPIAFPNLSDYAIFLKVYDQNKMCMLGTMNITNTVLGEVSYKFTNLDFNKKGHYNFVVELIKDDNKQVIPMSNSTYQIIIK